MFPLGKRNILFYVSFPIPRVLNITSYIFFYSFKVLLFTSSALIYLEYIVVNEGRGFIFPYKKICVCVCVRSFPENNAQNDNQWNLPTNL